MLGGLIHRGFSAGKEGGSPAVIQPLSVTENGQYEAPKGVDGFNPVIVDVSGSGDISRLDLLNSAVTLGEITPVDLWTVKIKWSKNALGGSCSTTATGINVYFTTYWACFYKNGEFKFAEPISGVTQAVDRLAYNYLSDGSMYVSFKTEYSNVSIGTITGITTKRTPLTIEYANVMYHEHMIWYDQYGNITSESEYDGSYESFSSNEVIFRNYHIAICRSDRENYNNDIIEFISDLWGNWSN